MLLVPEIVIYGFKYLPMNDQLTNTNESLSVEYF